MMSREVLRTSLNLEDEHELKLFNHAAKNKNVSAYLKRLILSDMEGKRESVVSAYEVVEEKEEKDDMSSFV